MSAPDTLPQGAGEPGYKDGTAQHIEASKCPHCGRQRLGWIDDPDTRDSQDPNPITRKCWQCEYRDNPPNPEANDDNEDWSD